MTSGVCKDTGRGCRFKDRTGQRNGRLVFVALAGKTKAGASKWLAKCDCGNETVTQTPTKTKSCGCLQKEVAAERAKARAIPKHLHKNNDRQHMAKRRAKYRSQPTVALQSRISRLYRHALCSVGGIKDSPTLEALGFTVEELRRHIERQFVDGMGWQNMHLWQIDHIVPAASAKNESDVKALNQLSNLRPMWADDNNRKNSARTHLL